MTDRDELPDWERDLSERALRWARGALPRDHPDHPANAAAAAADPDPDPATEEDRP